MADSALLSVCVSLGCLLSARVLIHYFQLESYQFPGYFRTLRRNALKSILPGLFMSFCLLVAALLYHDVIKSFFPGAIVLFLLFIGAGFYAGRLFSEKKAKKALVYTPRIKRLYVVSFVILFLILFAACGFLQIPERKGPSFLLCLFPLFLPLWIALCGLLCWPIEKGISELYFRDAQQILKNRKDMIKIGITGSWGKTSVKFILGTMLEEKYHTLITPASYNTPMGVTKVIRTMLEPSHRVFISEMGARHVGDIKEMCRLVHPSIGIITSVGPQHLDTFKTVERVASTKYELIESLPEDGLAFFSDDNGLCRKLYEKTSVTKSISGLDPLKDDVWAEDIHVSAKGSSFILCTKDERISCTTSLLGELNIRNILLCASVCIKLDLSLKMIARGIGKLKPVEHRLQLIDNPGGITIIDDAFNSNIRGAQQAFKVLREMSGKRFLVTPGMVELGEKEEEMNRLLGKYASDCCDIAILIGKKRSAAIAEGLRDGGFEEDNMIVVSTLEEATLRLKELIHPGDTVLYENDLPDNYTE